MRINRYRQLPVPPMAEIIRIYEAVVDDVMEPQPAPVPLALVFDLAKDEAERIQMHALGIKP